MQDFSITSWNAQRELNYTGYTSYKKFKSYVKTFDTDIILLQEMCNAKEYLKNIPELEAYNVFIPKINISPANRIPSYNFNVILSKYPILKTEEVVFPQWSNHRVLQNCTRVDIQLNDKILRIYNCQLPIFRAGIETRLKQLEFILSDAKNHSGPVIICSDMNTTIPKIGWKRWIISHWHHEPYNEMLVEYDERKLFNETIKKYGFRECLNLGTPTWSPWKSKIWEMFNLKLDWFIVKDLEVTNIKLGEYVSDHKSIEANCRVS